MTEPTPSGGRSRGRSRMPKLTASYRAALVGQEEMNRTQTSAFGGKLLLRAQLERLSITGRVGIFEFIRPSAL